VKIYANSHYVTPRPTLNQAIKSIKAELKGRLEELNAHGPPAGSPAAGTAHHVRPGNAGGDRLLRRHRELFALPHRPQAGRAAAHPVRILPDNAIVFADESHQTIPQIGAMYRGDFRRKATLAEYGFRLPSCMDNRPLRFEEWERHAAADRRGLGHARLRGSWSRPAASSPSRSSARPA
jgi:excinuclease ABC subunit B